MKERIQQIMKMEHMTQQDFAKAIGVSAASLSNIFNGKTNPTNNHVRAIHRHFPSINVNWLMFGEGNMYITAANETNKVSQGNLEHSTQQQNISSSDSPTLTQSNTENHPENSPYINKVETNNPQTNANVREVIKYIDKPQRKITEIRIFFDDGTYEVYS